MQWGNLPTLSVIPLRRVMLGRVHELPPSIILPQLGMVLALEEKNKLFLTRTLLVPVFSGCGSPSMGKICELAAGEGHLTRGGVRSGEDLL